MTAPPQTQGHFRRRGPQKVHDWSLKVGDIISKCGLTAENSGELVLGAEFSNGHRPCPECFPDEAVKWVGVSMKTAPRDETASPTQPEPTLAEVEEKFAPMRRRKVFSALLEATHPQGLTAIAKDARMGPHVVKKVIEDLDSRGLIRTTQRGDATLYAARSGFTVEDVDREPFERKTDETQPPPFVGPDGAFTPVVPAPAGRPLPSPNDLVALAQRRPPSTTPSLPVKPSAAQQAVATPVVVKPKPERQDYTIEWVPAHLKEGYEAAFTSTVKAKNREGAIRFLRDACQPCDIVIVNVDVKP